MARSIEEIYSYLVTALVDQMAAVGITINPARWSKRNILRAAIYAVAIGQMLMEQLIDVVQQQIEATVARSAAATSLWLQDKMFKFQFDAINPQILTIIDNVPQYAVVDTNLRIIAACSVKSTVSNQVKIKLAKGNPLAALATDELTAATSYVQQIGTAGITYLVESKDPDKLFIEANIYYKGTYSAVIQANVIAAIDSFLQNASKANFDGSIKVFDIEQAIRSVAGVNDVVLVNVKARPDTTPLAGAVYLVQSQTEMSRLWNTIAGYMVQETTVGSTFADTLTFIPE